MSNEQFIKKIAALIRKYAPSYGTSELAVNAHNYFGLKHQEGRCKTCIGVYHMTGRSEQLVLEVVEVVENRFLRKLFIDTRVYRGSCTKKAKNNYFNYFKHQF